MQSKTWNKIELDKNKVKSYQSLKIKSVKMKSVIIFTNKYWGKILSV